MPAWVFSEIDALVVSAEITKAMGGLFVSDVLGEGDEIVISFRSKGIYMKTRPPGARVHGIWRTPDLPRHNWRKFLRGARFLRASARRGERMVDLWFEGTNPLGERQDLLLVVELTGKYGNAILVDGAGVVIDALRRVRPGESRARVILPGQAYASPPPKQRNALALGGKELLDYLERYAPSLADELKKSETRPEDALSSYLERALSSPSPRLYLLKGEPLFPAPVEHEVDAEALEFPYYSEALDAFFRLSAGAEPESDHEEADAKRLRALERSLAEEEEKATRFYMMGQAIMANLHRIAPGVSELVAEGLVIPLDPKLTPGQNAEKYFEKYKRARRGVAKLKKILADGAPKLPEPVSSDESEPEPPGPPWLEFKSPSGFTVLVGKSARSNYRITFEVAKPHDLFFHVKGSPGAHVILRTEGRDVPEDDILFAARLALEHSRAGSGGKGLVSWAEKRYVVRPKGAKPGAVVLLRETVLGVRL